MKVSANARIMTIEAESMQETMLLWQMTCEWQRLGVIHAEPQSEKGGERRVILCIDMAATMGSCWPGARESIEREKAKE